MLTLDVRREDGSAQAQPVVRELALEAQLDRLRVFLIGYVRYAVDAGACSDLSDTVLVELPAAESFAPGQVPVRRIRGLVAERNFGLQLVERRLVPRTRLAGREL